MQINKSALGSFVRELSQIITLNQKEFVRWVAVQRCKDLTACGEVMPIEVETLWAKVDIRIHKWIDGLTMPANNMKLPLIYWANEPENYRASVAWIWQDLVQNHFRFVPISTKDPRPSLKLIGDIEALPVVPKTKALAKTA